VYLARIDDFPIGTGYKSLDKWDMALESGLIDGLIDKDLNIVEKLDHVKPQSLKDKIVEEAFTIFIDKRHEIKLYEGVENALSELSNKYILGVLTTGNADVYRFDFGKYFKFSISSLEAKNSKPNRAHFDKALEEVENITFDEIIHIGDHQINDILFASKLGIESLWFNKNNVDWEQEFEKPYEFNSWELLPKIIESRYE
jgi:putative hydrolase of the HAD superfamily